LIAELQGFILYGMKSKNRKVELIIYFGGFCGMLNFATTYGGWFWWLMVLVAAALFTWRLLKREVA
jgi:hypothetical protein